MKYICIYRVYIYKYIYTSEEVQSCESKWFQKYNRKDEYKVKTYTDEEKSKMKIQNQFLKSVIKIT